MARLAALYSGLARRPRARGRDGHRELRRRLDRRRDGPVWAHRASAASCSSTRWVSKWKATTSPTSPACRCPKSRHSRSTTRRPSVSIPPPSPTPRRPSGGNGAALAVYSGSPAMADPTLARPPQRHHYPDPGAVGRQRSDRRARLRPGLRRCHPPGALRGAAGHRAHAPDGDSRACGTGNSRLEPNPRCRLLAVAALRRRNSETSARWP